MHMDIYWLTYVWMNAYISGKYVIRAAVYAFLCMYMYLSIWVLVCTHNHIHVWIINIYIQKICELLFLLSTYLCAVRIHSYDSSFCLAHCLSLSLSSMLWLSHSSSSDNTHSYMCICFRKNTYSMSHSTTPNQRVWKTVTSAFIPIQHKPTAIHTHTILPKKMEASHWLKPLYIYTHTHTCIRTRTCDTMMNLPSDWNSNKKPVQGGREQK